MSKRKSYYHTLPDEVLFTIFEELAHRDLAECRMVCRSWHMPANRLYMKRAHFNTDHAVKAFLRYMKKNPSYVDLVQRLSLRAGYGFGTSPSVSDLGMIKGLFSLQYPNVRVLKLGGHRSLEEDNIKEMMLKSCPNLERLECKEIEGSPLYYYMLRGSQKTLTHLDISYDCERMTSSEFLLTLPRLEETNVSRHKKFYNCESWLPLFHQEFTLKSLEVSINTLDKDSFMERYTEMKTEEEKNMIKEKLGKLERLQVKDTTFRRNSLEFIAKYFTGLQHFQYADALYGPQMYYDYQNELDPDEICTALLDLICRVRSCTVNFRRPFIRWKAPDAFFSICNTYFTQFPPDTDGMEKIHVLNLKNRYSSDSCIYVSMESKPINRHQLERKLEVGVDFNEESMLRNVKKAILPHNMNVLEYHLNYRSMEFDEPDYGYFTWLQDMLTSLPTVTKLSMLMPRDHLSYPKKKFDKTFPQITYLELKTELEINRLFMWNSCLSMFPNIKFLNLKYFTGLYKLLKKEYVISLPSVKLERLYLDISPLLLKIRRLINVYDKFFVLDVNNKRGRYLYVVSLVYFTVTKISKEYFDSLYDGEIIPLCVHVYATEIQFITMYIYKEILYLPTFTAYDAPPKYLDKLTDRVAVVTKRIR